MLLEQIHLCRKKPSSTRKAHGTPEFLPIAPSRCQAHSPSSQLHQPLLLTSGLEFWDPTGWLYSALLFPGHITTALPEPTLPEHLEAECTEVGQGKPHGIFILQQNLLCLVLESQQPQMRSTRAEKECLRKFSAGLGSWVGCALQKEGCALRGRDVLSMEGGRVVGPPDTQLWRTITCSVLVYNLILVMNKAGFRVKYFKFFLYPDP